MEQIIQGFIIAIWVVLTLIFIRLGSILGELESLQNKSCYTCVYKHSDMSEYPCHLCVSRLRKYTEWKKGEKTDG